MYVTIVVMTIFGRWFDPLTLGNDYRDAYWRQLLHSGELMCLEQLLHHHNIILPFQIHG